MKSSDGFSLDFLYLNTLGYVCYSTSLILQVYSTLVRQQFHDKFGNYPLLSFIDVVYTVHGFILNTITLSLVYTKPFSRTLSWKVHSFTKFFYLVLFVFTASCLLSGSPTKYLTLAIDLAYFKISISFFKYIPQLYHNFTRKSVVGYPKAQIYLDLAGGTFSLLQLFLDNYIDNDGTFAWSEIFHNEGKFGLALVTFFFDFCFISQFWLYRHDHKQVKLVETFGSV
ncbi:unnamed protein product [Kuraishia capsulata CBS 1993]|uniref:Cystinosin n=1 Tax=Kuraishia capsulata CBS 1993 TaxID=1382522 RepID=W6MLN6_9ASCO|nr:uncharacterized protein KUCA_T00001737001 [Kuraishia capsulata CBS 1993]CDK25767.1 unnamed protein product [Kuraishia capsulata CBS 1993]